jgi:hypothetical protein
MMHLDANITVKAAIFQFWVSYSSTHPFSLVPVFSRTFPPPLDIMVLSGKVLKPGLANQDS